MKCFLECLLLSIVSQTMKSQVLFVALTLAPNNLCPRAKCCCCWVLVALHWTSGAGSLNRSLFLARPLAEPEPPKHKLRAPRDSPRPTEPKFELNKIQIGCACVCGYQNLFPLVQIRSFKIRASEWATCKKSKPFVFPFPFPAFAFCLLLLRQKKKKKLNQKRFWSTFWSNFSANFACVLHFFYQRQRPKEVVYERYKHFVYVSVRNVHFCACQTTKSINQINPKSGPHLYSVPRKEKQLLCALQKSNAFARISR